tara:strand:+ start:129 stop:434 length:306 start_codon:yes stop_codon:yes gene_type:complete
MTPQQLAAALSAGIIDQAQHDQHLATWTANQAERDNAEQAEAFMKEVEAAPLAQKKKLIKNKAMDLRVNAALSEDNFESRAIRRKASQLTYALRGTGGISF